MPAVTLLPREVVTEAVIISGPRKGEVITFLETEDIETLIYRVMQETTARSRHDMERMMAEMRDEAEGKREERTCSQAELASLVVTLQGLSERVVRLEASRDADRAEQKAKHAQCLADLERAALRAERIRLGASSEKDDC